MTAARDEAEGGMEVTYLSMDPVASTVGASQVVAYVRRLAQRGVSVDLHSFEHRVDDDLRRELEDSGIRWTPHRYGAPGTPGGLGRVVRLAWSIRGARMVHARSDMAAAAAMLAGVDQWLWDVRSLWADQKVATGVFGEGSPQARIFRRIERAAAGRATRIVTLTASAIGELERRYGGIAERAIVVTTCVDRRRFPAVPAPPGGVVRILLAGTLNRYYDVPLMVAFVRALARRTSVELVVAAPGETGWEEELAEVAASFTRVDPSEMPGLVADCHVGLSVCRDDAGPSLLAAMPTKVGEFLAVGRPVVVNAGLVDAATMLVERACGVVLGAEEGPEQAAEDLLVLLADEGTASRAAGLAADHFDLDDGVDALVGAYRGMWEAGGHH